MAAPLAWRIASAISTPTTACCADGLRRLEAGGAPGGQRLQRSPGDDRPWGGASGRSEPPQGLPVHNYLVGGKSTPSRLLVMWSPAHCTVAARRLLIPTWTPAAMGCASVI